MLKEKLPTLEIFSYCAIWISAVFYGIYNVYLIGNYYQHGFDADDFTTGWILNRKKDISDYEWLIWIPKLRTLISWLFVHLIGSEFIRWTKKQLLPIWYIFLPSMMMLNMFGFISTATLVLQPLVFYLIANFSKSKLLTWTTSFAIMILMNTHPFTKSYFGLTHDLSFILSILQMWIHLRCISFCLEVQSGKETSLFIHLLAYCLYLPLSIFGPIILFPEFKASMNNEFSRWTKTRFINFIFGLIRYTFWLFIMELWLHLIYSSAISFQPDFVFHFDTATLYGFGYCLGQVFMMKYTVVYGIPSTWANAEGVPAPHPPKCIGRIHLYSDMWRTFDQGLYNFLSRYIYIPVSCGKRDLRYRAVASLACFAFVYLWHGTMYFIFIWSLLNYIGVTIEVIARTIAQNSTFQYWQNLCLTQRGIIRFNAAVTSPLLFMSALSNFYFFAGIEVGNVFVYRSIEGIGGSSLVILALLYCCCHLSETVKQWEQQQKKVQEKNCLQ